MNNDQEKPQNQDTTDNNSVDTPPEVTAVDQYSPPPQTPPTPTKPQDAFAAASKAMADTPEDQEYDDYAKHAATYTAPKKVLRKVLIGVLVLVLVVAIAGAAYYWFVMRKNSSTKSTQKTTASQAAAQKTKDTAAAIDTQTDHYKSTNFALEFDYPKDWTVSETAASGKLTVSSPTVKLGNVNGIVAFMIRNKQQTLSEFSKGNAVAARESEKIAYTTPSPTQRGQTYISFLHYAGATGASTAFDGIYITGNTGYKAAQAIPKADFTPVDPIVSLTFTKTDGTPLSLPTTAWDDAKIATPLKNLLMSLVIQ